MPRLLRYLFGVLIAGLLVGGPIVYSHHRMVEMRSFRVVRAGVLYRSGQMSLAGLKGVIQAYGIKTVVTLRDAYTPGDRPPDWEEECFCTAEGIHYCRIPPRPWWASDDTVPAARGVLRFRAIMDDPANYPVLVHCFAGIHRTGAYCAVYRMEYEHWTNAEAIAEMRACGYRNIEDEFDLLGYLEKYQPRWKRQVTGAGAATGVRCCYPRTSKGTVRGKKHRKRHRRPRDGHPRAGVGSSR
jgi:protein tyrosine phosphatase (PTP) superfamily phosphohydrolase (DUF442 family)